MNYKEIRNSIREMIPKEFPNGKKILNEGKEIGKKIKIGKTKFMIENSVASEREYKEKMIKEKKIMFHAQTGLENLDKAIECMEYLYAELNKRGARLDRFGVCLDRRMGLPYEMRNKVPKETGLNLSNDLKEWKLVGQIVPIQPHFGDHMIGSPASIENTINALSAGVTTIGNFSQYFTFEYPLWKNDLDRAINTIKACSIMSSLKEKGVMIHSNIDDGFGSQFTDRCSIIGWAMLEYYVLEELVNAKLSHCFGNLVTSPKMRMAMVLALDEIHKGKSIGSMVNANTISVTEDFDRNFASIGAYCLADIAIQMKNPTGHAISSLPVTEAMRIPSSKEIVQTQVFANQLKKEVEKIYELIDFRKAYLINKIFVKRGRVFFERILDQLSYIIDITDPLQLILSLKNIGALNLEKFFSENRESKNMISKKKPYIPTSMFNRMDKIIQETKKQINISNEERKIVKDRKMLIVSTDIHEFGKFIVKKVLEDIGINVIDMGNAVDPDVIIENAQKGKVDYISISTHNGGALSYVKSLLVYAKQYKLNIPIFIGGKLNEDMGEGLPVDVTDEIKQLGIITCDSINDLISMIIKK